MSDPDTVRPTRPADRIFGRQWDDDEFFLSVLRLLAVGETMKPASGGFAVHVVACGVITEKQKLDLVAYYYGDD